MKGDGLVRSLIGVTLAAVAVVVALIPQYPSLGSAAAQGAVTQGCSTWTTRGEFAQAVRREYAEPFISRTEIAAITALRRCGRTAADRDWMIGYGQAVHTRLADRRYKARLSAQCADRPTWRVIRCIRYAALVHGADLGVMLSIASCESGFNPRAHNGSSGASGLFQFIDWRFTELGRKGKSVWSARWNALQAAAWLAGGGRSAWVC